jgi:hypothetical protein
MNLDLKAIKAYNKKLSEEIKEIEKLQAEILELAEHGIPPPSYCVMHNGKPAEVQTGKVYHLGIKLREAKKKLAPLVSRTSPALIEAAPEMLQMLKEIYKQRPIVNLVELGVDFTPKLKKLITEAEGT